MIKVDEFGIRYKLSSQNNIANLNWIFIPGGPGCDSKYLDGLVDLLKLPGNSWLIDLPGNGDNFSNLENFDKWLEVFIPSIENFNNKIIVGHSFGGQLPLLFPELESKILGLVILNSSPKIWLEEATNYAKEHNLPTFTKELGEFIANTNQETFNKALKACMPYYFTAEYLEDGKKWLSEIPFAYAPAVWWQNKIIEIDYHAKWVPTKIPAMIIGGEFDAICPYTLFDNDNRFKRDNIKMHLIKNAGHMPWFEQPNAVKVLFDNFVKTILDSINDVDPTEL